MLTIEQRSTLGWVYEISVKSGFLEQVARENPRILEHKDHRWNFSWDNILSKFQGDIDRCFPSEADRRSFVQYLNYLWPWGYAQGAQMGIDLFSHPEKITIADSVRIFCPFPRFPIRPSTPDDGEREAEELFRSLGVEAMSHERGRLVHADLAIEVPYGSNRRPPLRIVVDLSLHVAAMESQGRGLTDPKGYWRSPFRLDPLYTPVAYQAHRNQEKSAFAVHMFGNLRREIEDQLLEFYDLFSGREKSFFKTCQAASYLDDWCTLLAPPNGTLLIAGACTSFGLEVLESRFENDRMGDPLYSLREFYRKRKRLGETEDADDSAWILEQNRALESVLARLYRVLGYRRDTSRKAIAWHRQIFESSNRTPLDLETVETFWGRAIERESTAGELWHPEAFCNPASPLDHPVIARALEGYSWYDSQGPRETFRDLHADALRHGFFRLQKPTPKGTAENFSLTFALAHPGAGKTTTIIRTLAKEQVPCLFLYTSPRVSINDSVVGQIQEKLGERLGIAITTNSTIQQHASHFGHQSVVTYENWSGAIEPYRSVGYVPMHEMEERRSQFVSEDSDGLGVLHTHSDTETRRSLIKGPMRFAPVLRTLFDGTLGLLENRSDLPEMRFFLASVALQAFRSLQSEALFGFLTRGADSILQRCDPGERPKIVLMLDEVTGSSEGLDIVRMTTAQMRKAAERHPEVDFHLVIADASLVNGDILKKWLSSSAGDFPACVLWDSGGLDVPVFRRTEWNAQRADEPVEDRVHTLYDGATVVEASAYPAGRLTLHSLLRVDYANKQMLGPGKGSVINAQSLRLATITEVAMNAYRSCPSDEQVLIFVQDKHLLELVQSALCEGLNLPSKAVRILSADVGPKARKDLMADGGETVRIVLMTSAGSRGIDFPKVSRYVINVNHFAPESTLLEVQQVLFRGRGSGCDGLDREVWFTLSDILPEDLPFVDATDGERRFRRFLFDRLSMLALLRATLLTRASGRSWMPRRNDRGEKTDTVLCPLGETGKSEREMPIVSMFQNVLKSVDVLTQNGVLKYEQRLEFYQGFLSVFPQDSGIVYFKHKDPAETVWNDHPILGLLDPAWFSVFSENTEAHPKAKKARDVTKSSFLLDKPLVSVKKPRPLLQHSNGSTNASVWIRGFLCILEMDRARLKVRVPPSRVQERDYLRDLVIAFLKIAKDSGQERIADHIRPLREFARFLKRDDSMNAVVDQEDYGRDPGKFLVVTPVFPPHVQSDPDSDVRESEYLPWVTTLLSASAILDDRDKRRWPMLLADVEPILKDSPNSDRENPFLFVFSTSTGRPLRILRRLQTTRGFNLLAAALPNV